MTAQSLPPAAGDSSSAAASVRVAAGRGVGSTVESRPDEVRLCWEGDLDIASAPVLAAALNVLADLGVRTVALDVSLVTFMDCAGVGALVEGDNQLEDGVRLVCPSRAVVQLLSLVGLTNHLTTTTESLPPTSLPDTRATIERSKGLIMGAYGCTAEQASKILLSTALQQDVQVQVLASLLVAVSSWDTGRPGADQAQAVRRLLAPPGARS